MLKIHFLHKAQLITYIPGEKKLLVFRAAQILNVKKVFLLIRSYQKDLLCQLNKPDGGNDMKFEHGNSIKGD